MHLDIYWNNICNFFPSFYSVVSCIILLACSSKLVTLYFFVYFSYYTRILQRCWYGIWKWLICRGDDKYISFEISRRNDWGRKRKSLYVHGLLLEVITRSLPLVSKHIVFIKIFFLISTYFRMWLPKSE